MTGPVLKAVAGGLGDEQPWDSLNAMRKEIRVQIDFQRIASYRLIDRSSTPALL
jgi:hypothetical protein